MSKFGFDKVIKNVERTKQELPKILAGQAQSYFLKPFISKSAQEFDGKEWKEVQRRQEGTKAYKYPKRKDLSRRTRPILVGKTRHLLRAVNHAVKIQQWPKVKLVIDDQKAIYHQEGTENMEARPMVGQTQELTIMQKGTVEKYFNKVW